jgi:ribulose-phosphate 3-epimerase
VHPIGIAPSILAADFAELGAEVARIAPAVEWVHVDVMDGHYVPNLSLGMPVVASLRRATDRRLDCHLMITDPATYAPRLAALGVESVTFHPEVEQEPRALIDRLHELGVRVGVASKPDHPLADVIELLPHVDLLLVMSVEPGFGGQAFRPEVLPKLAEAAAWREANGARFVLQIDGGITVDTVASAASAGAELLVAGSAVFGTEDPVAAVRDLEARARAAVVGPRDEGPRR